MKTFKEVLKILPKDVKDIIEICKDVEQNPKWHPEGSVYNHIKIVVDRAIESGNINFIIAALFHDLGKAYTTKLKDGRWTSYGHENVSTKIVDNHKDWISKYADFDLVRYLVSHHMKIQLIDKMRPSKVEAMKENPFYPELEKFTMFDEMKDLTPEQIKSYLTNA
jgi:predicted HD phosphohydrolase